MRGKLFNTIVLHLDTGRVVETNGPHPECKAKKILNSILGEIDTDAYQAEVIPERFLV